jgi:Flp pilus assembly pilin Flp
MLEEFKSFLTDESGMETVEWAVVAALLVIGMAVIFKTLGNSVSTKLNNLNQQIQ